MFTVPEMVGHVYATRHPLVEVFSFGEVEGATAYDLLLRTAGPRSSLAFGPTSPLTTPPSLPHQCGG